jgi:hypothetical protein
MRTAAIGVLAASLTLAVLSFSGWALLDRAPSNLEGAILLEFFCGVGVAVSFVGLGVAIFSVRHASGQGVDQAHIPN